MAVDWRGDFHLRQLSAFLLDLLAVAAPPSAQKALIRGTFLAAIGFEVIKIVMTYTLPSLMKSPSGAAFGSVLGLMAFFYFFARLTLFCAAWIATAEYKDDPRMPGKHSLKIGRMRRTNLSGLAPRRPDKMRQHRIRL